MANRKALKFELENFKNEMDSLHYYQFKDPNGEVMLLSKGYQSARKRDNARLKLPDYAVDPQRYKVIKVGRKYQFVIKAGNNQALAASMQYPSKLKVEEAMRTIQKSFSSNAKPNRVQPINRLIPVVTTEEEKVETRKELKQLRFNFDLTFYQREDGKKLLGKMEYPLTKDRVSFENIDLEVIRDFLLKFMPGHDLQKKPEVVQKAKKEVAIPKVATVPLLVQESGKVVNKIVFNQYSDIQFLIDVPSDKLEVKDQFYKASIFAKSMRNKTKTFVCRCEGKLHNSAPQIQIPLRAAVLAPDIYQFYLEVNLYEETGTLKNHELKGNSQLLKFVNGNYLKVGLNARATG